MRQKTIELQGEIDESTVTVGNFSTPLTTVDRSSSQKSNKDTINWIALLINNIIDIYRILYPTIAHYNTFFSRSDKAIKYTPKKWKMGNYTKFPNHKRIKLVINNRKIAGKFPNTWSLNSILLR